MEIVLALVVVILILDRLFNNNKEEVKGLKARIKNIELNYHGLIGQIIAGDRSLEEGIDALATHLKLKIRRENIQASNKIKVENLKK